MLKTAEEIRRENLVILCKVHGLEVVAQRGQVSPAYIKQIINRTLLPPKADQSRSSRQCGPDVARSIEAGLGLPRGSIDHELNPETGERLTLTLTCYRSVERRVAEYLDRTKASLTFSAFVAVVGLAARHLDEHASDHQVAEEIRSILDGFSRMGSGIVSKPGLG